MVVDQQSFHKSMIRDTTNQLAFHDPVYKEFLEQDIQVFHKQRKRYFK